MKAKIITPLLAGLTLIAGLCCLPVTFIKYLGGEKFWFVSLTGLIFPFLIILLFLLGFVWLFKKSMWALFCFIILMLCSIQVSVVLPISLQTKFEELKPKESVRILSWNVSRWDERNKQKRGGAGYRPLMLDYIESTGADVLCLQEFFECNDPKLFEANIPALKKRGYLFYFFYPYEQLFEGKLQYGLCIFSRFPILKTGAFENIKSVHSEGLIYTDIQLKDTIVRIFTTDMESAGINYKDYTEGGKIKLSTTVLRKIKNSYSLRNLQAKQAAEEIKKSPYPVIICADLGDVPNSYAYFTLKSGRKDAFLQKGTGLGRTFKHISPTLRIDYIFLDSYFKINQFKTEALPYSDHYPLITDFSTSKKTTDFRGDIP